MKAARTAETTSPRDDGWSPAAVARTRDALVAGLLALLVATPLVLGDTVATGGYAVEIYPPIVLFMAWLLLPLAWAVTGVLSRRLVWRWERVDTLVVVMLGCIALSSSAMAWQGNPRSVINTTWCWLVLGVAYLLMRQLLDLPIYRRAAVATMLATATLLAMHGYYQYFYDMPQTRAAYEANAEELLLEQGIDPTPGSRERMLFESRLNSFQPLATFALTNSLAGFLVPWLVMAAGLLAVNWREKALWPLAPLGLGLVLGLAGVCLLLTESRTGYLALLAGLVAVGLAAWGWRPRRAVWLGLLGAGVLLLLVLGGVLFAGGGESELVSGAPASVRYRLEYWQATLAMIADYPLWGCGAGNFQDFYTAYMLPQASETIADPHNFLFEIWATAGTPAALCLLAVLGLVAWRWIDGPEASEDPPTSATQAGTPAPAARKSRQQREPRELLPPPDTRVLAVGILLGPALGWALGLAGGFEPEAIGLLLGWVGLVAVAWCLRGWVMAGHLPGWLPVIAGGALLVNLLAAGGISFPAVGINLWLLVALAMAGAGKERVGGLAAAVVVFVAALAVGAAYLMTAYWPPFSAYTQILNGDSQLMEGETYAPEGEGGAMAKEVYGRMQNAMVSYEQAAIADPYSPVPHQRQSEVEHTIALGQSLSFVKEYGAGEQENSPPPASEPEPRYGPLLPEDEAEESEGEADAAEDSPEMDEATKRRLILREIATQWNAALQFQGEVIARDRRSAVEQRRLGTRCLEAYRAVGEDDYLQQALAALERAVELYPAESGGQASLAWAYHLAGREKQAARHAAEALRLDDLNPHEDRDLARQDLFHQLDYIPADSPLRLAPVVGNPREWMQQLATPAAPSA